MKKNFDWLNNKYDRKVKRLKLWSENPRLNPEEKHITLQDFAEDLTTEDSDRKSFYQLVTSIVEDGFIPADPIVVWKEGDYYFVAEGNRRIVALKLLLEPHKAPKSIRSFIRTSSKKINTIEFEKVPVNVAPSFDDAEWYINQRNSSSSLQKSWSRVQQQRWVTKLYDKYNGDINKITSITKMSQSELERFIRILKIKDFVKLPIVKNNLSLDEFEQANSYRFPITILERFFNFTDVRNEWGIEFDGINVKIVKDKISFYNAFSELIKRILSNQDSKINTRITKVDLSDILSSLPSVNEITIATDNEVLLDNENKKPNDSLGENSSNKEENQDKEKDTDNTTATLNHNNESSESTSTIIKKNPNRNKLILDIYELNSTSSRLSGLFKELKKISLTAYKNSVSASLRVFLDLAVLEYIQTEGLESEMSKTYKVNLSSIIIRQRLDYLKNNKLNSQSKKIVARLIDPNSQYSLDVLNGYVHGTDTHYLNKQFLNGFWDFLFPLFEELLDIKEK